MLSLLSKIWLKCKKTIITYLKLHQISTVAPASAEAATALAHSIVAPSVVPEIEGSLKNYLTIFSQIMNLMPSIVL